MFLELKVKYLQSSMESFSSYADKIQQKQQQKYPTDFKQSSYDVLGTNLSTRARYEQGKTE